MKDFSKVEITLKMKNLKTYKFNNFILILFTNKMKLFNNL